jgi:hypothetical protein
MGRTDHIQFIHDFRGTTALQSMAWLVPFTINGFIAACLVAVLISRVPAQAIFCVCQLTTTHTRLALTFPPPSSSSFVTGRTHCSHACQHSHNDRPSRGVLLDSPFRRRVDRSLWARYDLHSRSTRRIEHRPAQRARRRRLACWNCAELRVSLLTGRNPARGSLI